MNGADHLCGCQAEPIVVGDRSDGSVPAHARHTFQSQDGSRWALCEAGLYFNWQRDAAEAREFLGAAPPEAEWTDRAWDERAPAPAQRFIYFFRCMAKSYDFREGRETGILEVTVLIDPLGRPHILRRYARPPGKVLRPPAKMPPADHPDQDD